MAQKLSIPLQVQPQAFGVLAAVSWCQCLHYERGYSLKSVWAIFIAFCCVFAGFEAGSVYALWVSLPIDPLVRGESLTKVIGRATKRSGVAGLNVWIYFCCPFSCCTTVSLLKCVVCGTLLIDVKATILGNLQVS